MTKREVKKLIFEYNQNLKRKNYKEEKMTMQKLGILVFYKMTPMAAQSTISRYFSNPKMQTKRVGELIKKILK